MIQIQAYIQKKTDTELKDIHNWIKNDNELLRGTQVNCATLKSLIFYQIKKVRDGHTREAMEGQEFRRIFSTVKQLS